MEWLFVNVAMGLDTLPRSGRVILLALLLATALYGLSKKLPQDPNSNVHVLYGKGALAVLVAVPIAVYLLGLKLPVLVPLSEFRTFNTPLPSYLAFGVLGIWLCGALWHCLRLAQRSLRQVSASESGEEVPQKLQKRVDHWCTRLAIHVDIKVVSGGSELAWHTHGTRCAVHIPSAAVNWPIGLFDVLVLQQLAQIKQGAWRWLLFGRVVQALYWPLPWVRRLVDEFAGSLIPASTSLAQSAYRDSEGWQRDVRNFNKRADTMVKIAREKNGLRLESATLFVSTPRVSGRTIPSVGAGPIDSVQDIPTASVGTFERKWAGTKARRHARHSDPYEQAYWFIAAACIAVAVATTLTLVPASPEFEPRFLDVKWQEQMSRRLFDNDASVSSRGRGDIVGRTGASGDEGERAEQTNAADE